MACLNLSNGDFVALTWSNAPNTNVGDVTIDSTANSISIEKAGFPSALILAGDFRYAVYGSSGFIALLLDTGVEPLNRTVFLVNIVGTNLTTVQVHLQSLVPNSIAPPNISHSRDSASLTFVWSSTGTINEVNTLSIVRSDNGDTVLTAFGPKSGINGLIRAEVTASKLIIHHPVQSGAETTERLRPVGSLTAIPFSQNFGEAVLGGANPALATITRTYTLRNDGSDCITVSAISANAPFSITAASAALLPIALDPDQERDIEVVFTPVAPGNVTRVLDITRNPANGDASLTCVAGARQAVASISVSSSAINFGTILHPGTLTKSFTVSNTGEINVAIGIEAAPAGSDFTWPALAGQPLPVGGTPFEVAVTFSTPGDSAATQRIITVTPTQGSARTVALNGEGCKPNAVIQVPNIAPLNYGQIERGFRTVRLIKITNNGDGDLSFRARITAASNPAHAALFGLVLPDNDITDALNTRQYDVLPQQRCGDGDVGSNIVVVAVSFFANNIPDNYSATLVVDQHNATNVLVNQTWSFPLTARVIDPVPIDAVLVLDRSGSMTDAVGERNKSEASISAGRLFIQMLRETAEDRAAIIRFNNTPEVIQEMLSIQGNRTTFESAMASTNFDPQGATNIAGGIIVGTDAFTPNPANPPVLKRAMIVLTDGVENRCFQQGGTGVWYSITGRDADDNPPMKRPDGTAQDSEPLPGPPLGIKVYGIGLGDPNQIDSAALNGLSTATGAYYDGVVDLSGKDYFLLEKYFTQIFMETAELQQISDPFYTINPGDVHEHEFDIFPGDVNAMVVLYDKPGERLPFFIVSPNREVFSGASLPAGFNIRYHSSDTARFVELFFPNRETDRYAGSWRVSVHHAKRICEGDINTRRKGDKIGDGFTPSKCRKYTKSVDYGIAIAAGSNLRMQSYIDPGVKYLGDTLRLTAVLSEAGLPVKNSSIQVTIEAPAGQQFNVLLRDNGLNQDGRADNGEYGVSSLKPFLQVFISCISGLRDTRASGPTSARPIARRQYTTNAVPR
jgi:hypothetical protein